MLQILERFGSQVGSIDYMGLRNSDDWFTFQALAAQLGAEQRRNEIQKALEAMSENERKAFFINLYNVMTFHGVTQYGRKPGSWNLYVFFITPIVSYVVGNSRLSLDDVEHGILRAQPGYFSDLRQSHSRPLRMPKVDPRIHMALNCGAKSCPLIATYSGANLDAELNDAVEAFVADDANVLLELKPLTPSYGNGRDRQTRNGRDITQPFVSVSQIFKFYTADFVGEPAPTKDAEIAIGLLQWMIPFMRGEKKSKAEKCVQLFQQATPGAKFEWLPYNWETNGVNEAVDSKVYKPRKPFTKGLNV